MYVHVVCICGHICTCMYIYMKIYYQHLKNIFKVVVDYNVMTKVVVDNVLVYN